MHNYLEGIIMFAVAIGMIVVDGEGRIGCGTSTNGLTHKIAG